MKPTLFAVAAAASVLALALGVGACSGSDASGPAASPTSSEPDAAATPRPTPAPPPPAPRVGDCRVELKGPTGWVDRGNTTCGAEGRIGVLVAGDVGWPGPILDATVAGMRTRCGDAPCDLGLLPGDLIYGDGSAAEPLWRGVWDEGFASVGPPFAAVLGNHEWTNDPNPKLKRQAVAASDGRLGLVAPGPSFAARVRSPAGQTLLVVAGLDTDSVANPGSGGPGLGAQALADACAEGAPVLWLGHHPPSSEGQHHTHEAHVETALRGTLKAAVASGCRIVAALAGHDHDLQAWGPGCEEAGMPGVVVAGPGARGFRPAGPTHLRPCPADPTAAARYHAGPKNTGGFAYLSIDTSTGHTTVELIEALGGGRIEALSTVEWDLPKTP